MNVKELKELLAKLDDDTPVYIDLNTDDEFANSNIWVSRVRDVYGDINRSKLRRVKDDRIAQRAHKDTAGAEKCLIL